MTEWKPIKTIRSYTGLARFLAECDNFEKEDESDIVGVIPRIPEIPSPYAYSPYWTVMRWKGKNIFYREVSHKIYKVFEVPADMEILEHERLFEGEPEA